MRELYRNARGAGLSDEHFDFTGHPLLPFGLGLSYTTFTNHDLLEEPGTWRVMVGASSRDWRLRQELMVP